MKHLKSIVFYLFIGLIIFSAGVATYVYFNADEIKERAVRGLNSVVISKVQVGKVSLSMFERFPNTTLVLEHVTINDPVQQERFLCKDATLFLDFNSLDLLLGNYNLNHIGLQADFVRLVKHPSQWNYILWAPDSTANSEEVNINLKSFDWQVDSLYLKVNGLYAESKTQGKLSFQDGLLSANTELGFANIFYQKKKYTLPKSAIELEGFDAESNQFASAKIRNNYLRAVAKEESADQYLVSGTCYQLKALGASLQVKDLPNISGEIAFELLANANDLENPTDLRFDVKNAAWSEKQLMSISGKVSLPNTKALDLAKFDLSGIYNGFDVSLASKNESTKDGKQILHLAANNAELPLESDLIALKADVVEVDVSLPKLSELQNQFSIEKVDFLSGKILGLSYSMHLQNQVLEVAGNAEVKNNSVVFKSVTSTVNGKRIEVDAVLPSVKPLLEPLPQLYLQLEVKSELLVLNALEEKKAIQIESDTSGGLALDYNIEVVYDLDKLSYDRVEVAKAYGSLLIRPGVIEIPSFSANTFDGQAYANGKYNLKTEALSLSGFLNGVSAEKVLKTFDNFHQEYVSYTNCRGNVDINFDLQEVAFWKQDWGYSKLNVHMYDAELKNLPFLNDIKAAVKQNKFAKFILNEDELFEKLSFINLQEAKANFVLKNETVFMSDAIFRSPEINLNSQGDYNTNLEEVDFEIQLYIKDFFARSVTEDNYYEPETKGSKLKFYLRGDASDPDVGMMKRDKKNAKDRPAFKPEKNIENEPKGSTIFVVEEGEKKEAKKPAESPKKEEKKKSGWFKKMLEKGGSLEDTSKVEFGIE